MTRLCLAALALSMPAIALADPYIDLVPQSLKYQIGLDDDVSGRSSQHAWIAVRNDGNVNFRNRNVITVSVSGRTFSGYVYGPESAGSVLGGPIAPGQSGKLFVSLPLGTLSHCARVRVHIDVRRTHQTSTHMTNVFANDVRTLQAVDMNNRSLCLDRPIPVDPPFPFPGVPQPSL